MIDERNKSTASVLFVEEIPLNYEAIRQLETTGVKVFCSALSQIAICIIEDWKNSKYNRWPLHFNRKA